MKIYELLDHQDAWTQGCFARNRDGHEVTIDDEDAVCWCLFGAIKRSKKAAVGP